MNNLGTLMGAVYGCAVGDALGVPYEFRARGSFSCAGMTGGGTHSKPAGTWSDDTSMALATCDSIKACNGSVDVVDMRERFEKWIFEGAYTADGDVFDYGNTTYAALVAKEGRGGEYDNGNGSLMRIFPLAFTSAREEDIGAVSAITHAHETSKSACVDFIQLIRFAISNPQDARGKVFREVGKVPMSSIKSGGYVLDTLKAAKWCFATTGSYKDCVLAAVNLGEDTDTTAAVAGALAGVVYGYDAIPQEWIETLRGKNVIDGCLF